MHWITTVATTKSIWFQLSKQYFPVWHPSGTSNSEPETATMPEISVTPNNKTEMGWGFLGR